MESEKIYILVVNPIAGGVDKTELISSTENFAAERGIKLISYETTGDNDEHKIHQLYRELRPERILVAGGDGTIKMVAEALIHEKVVFGILPAGSANGLAVDLNFPTDISEHLAIAFGDNHTEIDMVCINDKKSLHLSDIGLNAELIKNYENGTIRGKLGYAIQSFTTLKDQETPFTATIKVNDLIVEADAKMVVIANSNRYGTGVTINPFGKLDDGKFEIIILKNLDLMLFGKIITGNMPLHSEDIDIISAESAVITTNIPVHFQIDGEYYGEVTKLDIQILHKQMSIAVP
ncbi:MAG TPA: diacylglycerol kinase family protein [Flavobacterium sp.]|jgi:diacylglycerol kinase family enzyme|nr:diacylglycerol kinase family protein [Flavobacterium sp.]